MGLQDSRAYLAKLPLHKVVEIHINHPYNDKDKQMLDFHGSIGESDAELLRWVLDRAPKAQAVNLESHEPSKDALLNEVRLVRQAAG